jgi:hypothetical protein
MARLGKRNLEQIARPVILLMDIQLQKLQFAKARELPMSDYNHAGFSDTWLEEDLFMIEPFYRHTTK